jgi:ABC-type hemin transport system ATPase subunit
VITLNGQPLREWSLAERAPVRCLRAQGQASTFGFTAMEMVLMVELPISAYWGNQCAGTAPLLDAATHGHGSSGRKTNPSTNERW